MNAIPNTARALLAAFAACAALALPQAAAAQAPKPGGSVAMGLEADFVTLDVLQISSLSQREVALQIFDPLFEVDVRGQVVPHLVERFTASPDARVYTLVIRPGVTFHDGTPLDAEAVAFNLNRVRDPKNACRCLSVVANIEDVRAVGPLTVEVRLKSPSATLPAVLTDTPGMMVSPTAVRRDPEAIASNPVGTGPFMMKEWIKGDRVTLVRNPNYWRKGLPHLDQVTYRPIANDESRHATMLSGGIQLNQTPGAKAILEAQRSANLKVMRTEALGTYFVMMNTQKGDVADVRVRRAIAHATDSRAIIKALYSDLFEPAQSPFPKGSSAHQERVAGYPTFDLEKARALVKEIGKPIEVTVTVQNVPDTQRLAETLGGMWSRAGIKTNIQVLQQVRVNEAAFTKNYEAMIFRIAGAPDPDLNVYRFFHSQFAPGRSTNFTQYANPEMDALLDEGQRTLDPARRKEIYGRISELIARDVPWAFLFAANFYTVAARQVQGLEPVPDGRIRMRSVWLDR